ncbi:MAG: hypothetical protein ACKO4A_19320 [Gammaproteobacteria bacterium]
MNPQRMGTRMPEGVLATLVRRNEPASPRYDAARSDKRFYRPDFMVRPADTREPHAVPGYN